MLMSPPGRHREATAVRGRDKLTLLKQSFPSVSAGVGAPGLSSVRSSQPDKGINPRTHTSVGDRSSGGEPQVTEQNDVTKLYEEFEEAFVDVLSAKSEGVSFSRRMKLRLARSRLRAHKDFTRREYDAAVLRADARAWKILG